MTATIPSSQQQGQISSTRLIPHVHYRVELVSHEFDMEDRPLAKNSFTTSIFVPEVEAHIPHFKM